MKTKRRNLNRPEYKCACRTFWLADLGDGEKPIPAHTAVDCLFVGIPIRLGQVSTSPLMSVGRMCGFSYPGDPPDAEWCRVCGEPLSARQRKRGAS